MAFNSNILGCLSWPVTNISPAKLGVAEIRHRSFPHLCVVEQWLVGLYRG